MSALVVPAAIRLVASGKCTKPSVCSGPLSSAGCEAGCHAESGRYR